MYIDPNTGGALFQALAVAFTAISGAVLVFSNQIKMFFKSRRRSNDGEEMEQAEEANSEE